MGQAILVQAADLAVDVVSAESSRAPTRRKLPKVPACSVCKDAGYVMDHDEVTGQECDVDCPACGGQYLPSYGVVV